MAATETVFSKRGIPSPLLPPILKIAHNSRLNKKQRKFVLAIALLYSLHSIPAHAAGVKPETVAAFNRYIEVTEARMKDDPAPDRFLAIDPFPDEQRKQAYEQLHRGEIYIEELQSTVNGEPIRIPSGLIHHWVGVMFIPKVTLSETDAVLHDYASEANIYGPQIRRARLIQQNGNESKIYLQFYNKSIITVVLDAYFDVAETKIGTDRIQSIAHSTRVVEVLNPGAPNEHERTDGV